MKKILISFTVFIVLLSLAGCEKHTSTPPPSSNPSSEISSTAASPEGDASEITVKANEMPTVSELRQLYRNLANDDDERADDFDNSFICFQGKDVDVFRTTGMMGYNTILLRDTATGEWSILGLGDYSIQEITYIFEMENTPHTLFIDVDGNELYGDGSFKDFHRRLKYDTVSKELSVFEYGDKFESGIFGGEWNGEKNLAFVPLSSDEAKAAIGFKLVGEMTATGYSTPRIDIDRVHKNSGDKESDIWTVKFKNTNSGMTMKWLDKLKALDGVIDINTELCNNEGFTGTVLSVEVEWPYILRFRFRQGEADTYDKILVLETEKDDSILN